MTQDIRGYVGKGLDILRDGLGPFVRDELETLYGKQSWYVQGVQPHISQSSPVGEDHFAELDINDLLTIISKHLNQVFNQKLNFVVSSNYLYKLRQVRNDWAHQRHFTVEEAKRALTMMTLLLQQARATKAAEETSRLASELVLPISEEELRSRSVGEGLHTLTELMRAKPVRDTVAAFQADFRAACDQIDLLSTYKDIHDLLHTLQFKCYNCIVQEVQHFFSDDKMARDNLMDYDLEFRDIINDLQIVAEKSSFATTEIAWVNDLIHARSALHGAVDTADRKQLQRAIWLIEHVLAVRPSQVNVRLNDAARALRLPALVQAMRHVCDNLSRLALDPEKLRQFQADVDALSRLRDTLPPLIDAHDHWQLIDCELRRIEAELGHDIAMFEWSWSDLMQKAKTLYTGSTEAWAMRLQSDSARLDAAIAEQNRTQISYYFQRYRSQVSDHFYWVDKRLKELCEELRRVGEPLAFVLKMLE